MSLFFSTATLLAQPASVSVEDAYATSVAALGELIAHWRLGDTSTASLGDASGHGHAGSYAGSPALQALDLTEAWQASDGRSVDFGASGSGTVAHDAAFALAQGSLAFWFEVNSLTSDQELISKGDFGVVVTSDGALEVQFTSGDGVVLETRLAGIVSTGETHHVMVSWTGKAAWLWLDGRWVGRSTTHTAGLTGNSSAWTFGAGDVQMDEIALYGAARTYAELQTLSQFVGGLGYRSEDALDTIDVSDASGLSSALSSAAPGDHIVLADGTYAGDFNANVDGTRANPIVIRAANVGGAVFSDSFDIQADWNILDGIEIASTGFARLRRDCRHSRITRCRHDDRDGVRGFNIEEGCDFCRIDHCTVGATSDSGSGSRHGIYVGGGFGDNAYYLLIDHNYVEGATTDLPIGTTPILAAALYGRTHVYKCLVAEANDSGSIELKANDVLVEACTVLGPQYSHNRLGNRCEWRSCYIKSDHNAYGGDHWIIGCTFDGSGNDLRLGPGDVTPAVRETGSGNYPASQNGEIIGCTFLDGAEVLAGEPDFASGVAAEGWSAEGCTNWAVTYDGDYTGTITHTASTSEPYEVAVQLSTSDVGPAAADPLVPPGWK